MLNLQTVPVQLQETSNCITTSNNHSCSRIASC